MSPNKPAHDEVQDRKTHGIDAMDEQATTGTAASRIGEQHDAPATEPDDLCKTTTGTPNGIRSSPPALLQDGDMDVDRPDSQTEDLGEKGDSEAETIVLPGKDGHSPSKIRKSIKHEDKTDDEDALDAPVKKKKPGSGEADVNEINPKESIATSMLGKRKRSKHGNHTEDSAHLGNSSGLSSVPTSPVATTRSSLSKPAASDSEISKSPSPRSRSRSSVRDKAKSVDRVLPRKRHYASDSGGEDEADPRAFGRRRGSGTDHKASRPRGNIDAITRKRTRSNSPQSRSHKRSISTQLPPKSSHGLSHKKKRVPTPLQSTEYHSDESSISGSSHPRSSRLRSLAAPVTGESVMSPAKMPPHKKHVNSSGQTLLMIACSRGKLENVKQRYEDRPEDLNVADNAMNTPLHSASLDGYVDIVKFLLDTGNCEVDSVNVDRDTPLHDAVDNVNVEVVKLLLEAGANPSKPNLKGNEPLDLVVDVEAEDEDEYEDEDARNTAIASATEMREAIVAAKLKFAGNRRGSEDHPLLDANDGRLSHPKGSPRQTPPANELLDFGPPNRIARTARSMMKTKDRDLWKGYTIQELRAAASEGDAETTHRILNVKPEANDPRVLYNAARGGHDNVINLLFALGKFSPDPGALEGVPTDQSTPILAAIGKDNHLEVIRLFTGNSAFDPSRRVNGETYHEIARRRAGPNWQNEEQLLKDAFVSYQKSHKTSPGKPRSPGARRDGRDVDQAGRRNALSEDSRVPRTHKRSISSPKQKDIEQSKSRHRSNSSLDQSRDGHNVAKRGPGRPRKEENSVSHTISDRDTSPLGPPKSKNLQRKSESDAAAVSESELAVKPRRKLVSGKEFRGERELEKQRRASIVSNASSVSVKEKRESTLPDSKHEAKSGPNAARIPAKSHSTNNERDQVSSDKERARPLKRDDSKDRLSAIRGESPVKRPRKSETPPRSGMQEVTAAYENGPTQKRRKLDGDVMSGRKTDSSSPEHRTTLAKGSLSREDTLVKTNAHGKTKPTRTIQEHNEASETSKDSQAARSAHQATKPGSSVSVPAETGSKRSSLPSERTGKTPVVDDAAALELAEEQASRSIRAERERKEAEAVAEAIRQKENEDENERLEQARMSRLAREQAVKEEEEKRQQGEAERKERQRLIDVEANNRVLEEQRALYLEQERVKKEEAERRHAAALEFKRAEKVRIDKIRRDEELAKLPLLLRWFDQAFDQQSDIRAQKITQLFHRIVGYRFDTIKPEFTGQPVGQEQWMLTFHAAILLGERDLQLSQCKPCQGAFRKVS